jgi:phosphoribosylanthranilate isomerase
MENRLFTKFCGITSLKDALNAQSAGCDAVGFVFVKSSKRYIELSICKNIINQLSPALMKVALFANNSESEIRETIDQCSFHVLQFHGSESAEFCRQWGRPYWKAVPMADDIDLITYVEKYPDANGFLLDNFGKNQSGGSGKKFSWNILPDKLDNKWILAGGLSVENIHDAKKMSGLDFFDVSSGIEVSPGIKSKTKMINFIKNLND